MYFYVGSTGPLFVVAGIKHPGTDDSGWILKSFDALSLKEVTINADTVEEEQDADASQQDAASPLPVSSDKAARFRVRSYPPLNWNDLNTGSETPEFVDVSHYGTMVMHGGWFFYGVREGIPAATRVLLHKKNGPTPYGGGGLGAQQENSCPFETRAGVVESLSRLQNLLVEQ